MFKVGRAVRVEAEDLLFQDKPVQECTLANTRHGVTKDVTEPGWRDGSSHGDRANAGISVALKNERHGHIEDVVGLVKSSQPSWSSRTPSGVCSTSVSVTVRRQPAPSGAISHSIAFYGPMPRKRQW